MNQSDFSEYLYRLRTWSQITFGPGARTAAIIDHIKKELVEIERAPDSTARLEEWIDVASMALDGAWRCGAPSWLIIAAFVHKQEVNESRHWPDWRTQPSDKAIEHIDTSEIPEAGEEFFKKAKLVLPYHEAPGERPAETDVQIVMRAQARHMGEQLGFLSADAGRLRDRVAKLEAALKPFADYADPAKRYSESFTLTQGSHFAKRQITMGDCYRAAETLAEVVS